MRLLIREARKAQRRTLQEVADALGKSRATIHRYETARVPVTFPTLAAIARYLNVPLSALIEEHATNGQPDLSRAD